ncbi:uncharacterized protein [Littorina saxatilis]|uniref:Uncharacterized protein n=1 Tax=Littorina saxatilis TaxID=31220 RepID=A0AAN9G745_9CAEN
MAMVRAVTVVTLLLVMSLSTQNYAMGAVILTFAGTGSETTSGQTAQAQPSGTGSGGNSSVNGNVEVIFASPETQEDGGSDGGTGGVELDLAHMTVMVDEMTRDDWMAFICDRIPSTVADCRGVQDLKTYLEVHSDRLLRILTSAKKRKRQAGTDPFWTNPWQNFGSSSLGFPPLGFDPWQPFQNPAVPSATPQPGASPGGFQSNPFGQFPTGGNDFRQAVICPTPLDQTSIYQPVSDGTGYPAGAVGQEIASPLNLQLRACLAREVVTAVTGPIPVSEPFRNTVSPTCPYTQLRLWRYQSLSQRAECWVLQNFGDFVLYRTCTNKFCSNARNSFHGLSGFNSPAGAGTNVQKLCIPDYRAVSFWAYCPLNRPGLRLVRDRIILPITCNCQGVRCEPLPNPGFQG